MRVHCHSVMLPDEDLLLLRQVMAEHGYNTKREVLNAAVRLGLDALSTMGSRHPDRLLRLVRVSGQSEADIVREIEEYGFQALESQYVIDE